MSEGERRLAAIMFTDMVGYTALGQRNESLSLALVEEQRKLIRPILSRHNGKEIKTIGDSFLVEFPSALDAVRCAYDVQRAAREFNISLPEERRFHIRVGIHLGDVVEMAGDIFGDAVNVASRIEALAEEDGVCLTRQVYDHVQRKFEIPLSSLGSKSLKNVTGSVEVFKMVMPWSDDKIAEGGRLNKRRIAVLPFTNISPDSADAFFADGMTEELISTISRITGLRVIARTSIMNYKNSPKRISEIGRELGVGSILEGSVRKAGERIRVTIQLIDADNEEHLWADDYDRSLQDVFEIQSDIAKRVAQELRVKLLPQERGSVERSPTNNSTAFTFYLKGLYYWNERTQEALDRARIYFEKAIELDPDYAAAYSGLADTYSIMANNNYLASRVALPKAASYAKRALQLDGMSPEAQASLGFVYQERFDWKKSEEHYRKALELNPSYATGHFWYGILLTWIGRHEEALAEARLAEELDPMSPAIMIAKAQALTYARRYSEAVELFERAIQANPDLRSLHFVLGLTRVYQGEFAQALKEAEKAESLSSVKFERVSLVKAMSYVGLGRNSEARGVLAELEMKPAESWVLAMLYLTLGDKEKAIELLQKGFDEMEAGFGWIGVVPTFDELRTDARFVSLLKAINLA